MDKFKDFPWVVVSFILFTLSSMMFGTSFPAALVIVSFVAYFAHSNKLKQEKREELVDSDKSKLVALSDKLQNIESKIHLSAIGRK